MSRDFHHAGDSPGLAVLKAYVAESPLDMALLDREGCVLEISPSVSIISGISRDFAIGKHIQDLFGDVVAELVERLAGDAIAVSYVREPRSVRLPNGELHFYRTSISPWRRDDGEIGGVVAVNHNVTREERAQLELSRAEAMLDAIVENIPAMISVQDRETGAFVRVNRATEDFVGIHRDRLTDPELIARMPKEPRRRHWARIEEADAAGGMVANEEDILNRDHEQRTLLVRRGIIADRGGGRYVLTVGEDITERKRADAELQAALTQAEAANHAKSTFLATMSHEIRTPLNGVLGMAQAMAMDTLLNPDQRERLGIIQRSGETLLTILNDVLDLSKIEAGKLTLETAEVDIEAVASSVHDVFGPTAETKGCTFVLAIEPGAAGRYQGDPTRVRQILYNLVSNALKFTETGEIRVTVGAGPEGLELSVQDSGIGIAPEQMDTLFCKFEQADASTTRRFGGSGLGLAICHELVTLMGGSIRVESRPGQGATFRVVLPLPWLGEAIAPRAEEAVPDLREAPSATTLRVLAAEDNPVNQQVLKAFLRYTDAQPHMVATGGEAVAAWEAQVWDLILMDIHMPQMDGLAATRIIREREEASGRARTPIIALTANVMPQQVEEYRAAGMDGFVAKPIEVRQLFAALETALTPDNIPMHRATN